MQVFEYKTPGANGLGEYNVQMCCYSKNTRNGFAHVCSLIINGHDVGTFKVNYLNRTWEMFTFDSVKETAVMDYAEYLYRGARSKFMNERGYKKLTTKRKKELGAWLADKKNRSYMAKQLQAWAAIVSQVTRRPFAVSELVN